VFSSLQLIRFPLFSFPGSSSFLLFFSSSQPSSGLLSFRSLHVADKIYCAEVIPQVLIWLDRPSIFSADACRMPPPPAALFLPSAEASPAASLCRRRRRRIPAEAQFFFRRFSAAAAAAAAAYVRPGSRFAFSSGPSATSVISMLLTG